MKTRLLTQTGRVSKSEREEYLNGKCYLLALAIHRITGWSLVGVKGLHPLIEFFGLKDTILHVGILRPDGRYQDMRGIITENEFKTLGGMRDITYEIVFLTEEEVVLLAREQKLNSSGLKDATSVVHRLWPLLSNKN